MEDKQLISKFQVLKGIKPRKDWVVLAKSEIFNNNANVIDNKVINKITYKETLAYIFNSVFNRKFAYGLAAFLFIVAGIAGFSMKYNLINDAEKAAKESTAALVLIKDNVETFKEKSQNLIDVVKNRPQDFSLAIKEVNDAAKNLTEAIEKDPKLAKGVALEIRDSATLLSIVSESELEKTSDILYKTIDEQMIKDLDKTILTEEQQEVFNEAKALYGQGKYSDTLEKILLINGSDSKN